MNNLWKYFTVASMLSYGLLQAQDESVLRAIDLPDGFEISYFATNIEDARSLCLSPEGTLFVGSRSGGNVYALRDDDCDGKAENTYLIASGLKLPNGVAVKDGHLYVAEMSRVLKYENIEEQLGNPPDPEVIFDSYPNKSHHGWKYIAFGPDGYLYIPVGAPCNICESKDPVFASITRLNVESGEMEIVQKGIRNTVGFNWHPETDELWFTDNGRDWLGDDLPACELNHAPRMNMHFGYPYCHQGDLPDPEFGGDEPCSKFTPPAQNLGPHVAPLGMEFIRGGIFPSSLDGNILIAEHGSWNRSKPIGYRLTMVTLEGNNCTNYEVFASGWLTEDDTVLGRPVDLEWMPDGALLVSDDHANVIYRIEYKEK